jgi:hypothetical protein
MKIIFGHGISSACFESMMTLAAQERRKAVFRLSAIV